MTTKTKVHTIYKNAEGTRLPGVTTVLGILNKPALLDWAWKLGLEGEDYKKVRDKAGDIGTLAHYLIMCHLTGQKPDTSEYSPENLDKAENCLLSYYEWEKSHPFTTGRVEEAVVSERYQYGGTFDCLAMVGNQLELLDFKTGKGIYPEMIYQLAAYRQLINENGLVCDTARILRIGRTEDEGFEERICNSDTLDKAWEVFKHCLGIYKLQNEIRKEN